METREYFYQRSDFVKIKKILVYFSSFLALSLMFATCYYFSYKNALNKFNERAVEQNKELMIALQKSGYYLNNSHENNLKEEINTQTEDNSTMPVASSTDRLTENSIFIVQNYDIKTGITKEEVSSPPSYLIGLNREEIMDNFKDYMESMPMKEYAKGLISYELVSLSSQKVVAKKTYNLDAIDFAYIITIQDDKVIVYYADGKTIFHAPRMSVDELSSDEKIQLEEGIHVKEQSQIWSILEGFTS